MTQGSKHKPTDTTRTQVKRLAAVGMTQERAAEFMGLATKTFVKHYKDEFDNGKDEIMDELFSVSYDVAKDPNHKDGSKERQFILKTRGGFKETTVQEMQGELKTITEVKWVLPKPSK